MNGNGRVNGRLPRYRQLAQALRARIREGTLRPGARLDTQRRLATSFGVTLMTLRQALELLGRAHLLTRRHGLGTFVAAPSIDYDILQLRRFAGDLTARGAHVATRLLGTPFAVADRRVAEALKVPARGRVLVLGRRRLVDDHPMSLQRSFLPLPLGDEVVRADLASTPLHQVLEFKLGVVITRARETVSAVRLGRREARELGCRAGGPAVESEGISYDAGGAPGGFDRVFLPGGRFRIPRGLHHERATS